MLERKTVSQCPTSDYCRGWNDAVDAMPRWVRVDKLMPPYNEEVLVYRPRMGLKVMIATYDGFYGEDDNEWHEGWSVAGFDIHKNPCITHWMSLPQPPKEE